MITQWNDDEDMALQGLRPATQIIYLRGLRRFMDYQTGIVGINRRVSYPSLIECCEFLPDPHSRQKPEKKNKEAIRAAFAELERAGLVKKLDGDLVFFLPLADTNKSVQILNNPCTTLEQPLLSNTQESRNEAALGCLEQHLSNTDKTVLSNTHRITDNCFINPSKEGYVESVEEKVVSIETKRKPAPPYQEIVDAYHQALPTLSQVYKLTDSRKAHIKTLWADELDTLDAWKNYFGFISRSDFLMGRSRPDRDGRIFLADFDFIVKPGNFVKIAEEKYHGKKVQR